MYTGHLRLFLGIGALFVPLGLIITGVQYLVFRLGGLSPLVDSAGSSNAVVDALAFLLGLVFTIIGLAIVQTTAALTMLDLDERRGVTTLSAFRKALPKLPSLLGAVVAATVVVVAVYLTAIGAVLAIWLMIRWALLAQVVAFEDQRGLRSLRRSAELVRGRWWRVASLTLFVSVVGLLLGPLIGTLLLFATDASFDFVNLVSGLVYAIALPFVAIASTYLYFDLLERDRPEAEPAPAEAPVTASGR
jgi:hypothetical protein